MASANVHKRKRFFSWRFIVVLSVLALLAGVLSLTVVTQAQGSGEEDASTIGLGVAQSTAQEVSAPSRIDSLAASNQSSEIASEAVEATDTAQRSITVKDPDPVIVPVAVDYSNPNTVEKAKQYCTLDPLPTAPRISPDLSDGTWSRGTASAYNVATNDDGQGNFGVSTTASGVSLHGGSVTVAVPESKAYLLGSAVEICYDGKVVVATVTDTGGFAKYGRALDLAPGVYSAFGFSSPTEWGTRTVSYRFL